VGPRAAILRLVPSLDVDFKRFRVLPVPWEQALPYRGFIGVLLSTL
jgi:hypothetical protein